MVCIPCCLLKAVGGGLPHTLNRVSAEDVTSWNDFISDISLPSARFEL